MTDSPKNPEQPALVDNPYVGPRTFEAKQRRLFFGREEEAAELLALVAARRLVLFYAESGAGKSSLLNTRLIPGLVEKRGFEVFPIGRVGGDPVGGVDVDNIFVYNLILSLLPDETHPERFAHLTISDFLLGLESVDSGYIFTEEVAEESLPDSASEETATPTSSSAESIAPENSEVTEESLLDSASEETATATSSSAESIAPENSEVTEESLLDSASEETATATSSSAESIAPKTSEAEAIAELWPRALILDQFEEIFTSHPEAWKKRENFFDQLRVAMEEDPYLWVVLVMREDYVARMSPYASLLPGELRSRSYMQRMREPAALEAVQSPAAELKRPFEPEAAQLLVENLRQIRSEDAGGEAQLGEFVEPVQLQVVCFQLWESLKGQPGTTITKEDLLRLAEGQDVGRFVNTALRNFYGDALTKVLGDARTKAYNDRHEDELITEEHLRNWFDKELITEQKTRGLVNRGPTHTGSLPNVAVDLLQRQFIVRTESRAGSTWYELVHDRFISPIMESNRAWWSARAVEDPVLRAAQLWEGQGRDPELLFTGKLLDQVQQQVDVRTAHPLVQEFIEASRKLSARKLEEAERQRDEAERRAEAFGALATREQAQSQRLKKQTRQLTAAVAAAVFLLVVAVILAIRAQDNEQIAKEEAAKATAAQMKLESLTLAQRANDALDDQDIERGVALAIAASGIMTDSSRLPASVYHALARAMYASNLITTVHTSSPVYTMDYAPARDQMLTGDDAGNLVLWNAASGTEIRRFALPQPENGNGSPVWTVALSPDGRHALSGGQDGAVRLWDVGSGALVRTLPARHGTVRGLAFNPANPGQAVSGGTDGTVVVWDLEMGSETHRLAAGQGWIYDVAISPDGRRVLFTSDGGDATLWNPETGEKRDYALPSSGGGNERIRAVAFVDDGQAIFAGNSLALWDLEADRPIWSSTYPGAVTPDYIVDLALTSDGRTLFAAGSDITLWDLRTGQWLETFEDHDDAVRAVAIGAHGDRLLSAGLDQTVRTWDLTGAPLLDRHAVISTTAQLAAAPQECSGPNFGDLKVGAAVTLGEHRPVNGEANWADDMKAYVGRRALITSLGRTDGQNCPVVRVDVDDGRFMWRIRDLAGLGLVRGAETSFGIGLDPTGAVMIWDIPTGRLIRRFILQNGKPQDADVISDTVVVGTDKGTLMAWDLYTGASLIGDGEITMTTSALLAGDDAVKFDLIARPAEQQVLVATVDDIQTWQIVPGGRLTLTESVPLVLPGQEDARSAVEKLEFDAKSQGLFVWLTGTDVATHTVNLDTGQMITTTEGPTQDEVVSHLGVATLATFGSQEDMVLYAHPDGGLASWDPTTDEVTLLSDAGAGDLQKMPVMSLAKSPKDEVLLAGYLDGTVGLWDLSTHSLAQRQRDHETRIYSLAVTQDGRSAISADRAGRIVLWSLPDLEPLRVFTPTIVPDPIMAISDDGRFAVWSAGGQPWLWDVDIEDARETPLQVQKSRSAAPVKAVALAHANPWAAVSRADGTVELWDLEKQALLFTLRSTAGDQAEVQEPDVVTSLLFGTDDAQMLMGTEGGRLTLFAVESTPRQLRLKEFAKFFYDSAIDGLVLSDDERTLLVSLTDYSLSLRPLLPSPGQLVTSLRGGALARSATPWCSDLEELDFPVPIGGCTPAEEVTPAAALAIVERSAGAAPDGSIVGTIGPNERAIYTFTSPDEQVVALQVTVDRPAGDANPAEQLDRGLLDTTLAAQFADGTTRERGGIVEGSDTDSSLANVSLQAGETITLVVSAAAPTQSGAYTLTTKVAPSLVLNQAVKGKLVAGSGDTWTFRGETDQLVTIAMDKSTQPLDPYLTLFRSGEDTALIADDDSGGEYNALVNSFPLPEDGLYVVEAKDLGSGPGAYVLRLTAPVVGGDHIQAQGIVAAGAAVTGVIDDPGSDLWVFMGQEGELLDIRLDADPMGALGYQVLDSRQLPLLSNLEAVETDATRYVLPKEGQYAILVTNAVAVAAPYTLTIASPPRAIRTLTPSVPVASTVARPEVWQFQGSPGQVVSIFMTSPDETDPLFSLLAPDGTRLASVDDTGETLDARLSNFSLAQAGSYQIVPGAFAGSGLYSLTLRVSELATLSPGLSTTVTITEPLRWRFTGAAGQVAQTQLESQEAGVGPYLALKTISDTLLAGDPNYDSDSNAHAEAVLPADGSYIVAASSGTPAQYTLSLTTTTAPELTYGTQVTSTFAEDRYWQFAGAAGQGVRIQLTPADRSAYPSLALKTVSGTDLSRADSSGGEASVLVEMVLPADGAYIVEANGGGNLADYTLALTKTIVPELTLGDVMTGTTAERPLWQFRGVAGGPVRIELNTTDSGYDPQLEMRGPDGTLLRQDYDSGTGLNARVDTILPVDGIYLVRAGPGGSAAEYTLSMNPLEVSQLAAGQPVQSTPAERSVWQFTGTAGQGVRITLDALDDLFNPYLQLQTISGTLVAENQDSHGTLNSLIDAILPADGIYLVVAGPTDTSTDGEIGYQLELRELPVPELALGEPMTGTTAERTLWQFKGEAGQPVRLTLRAPDSGFDPYLTLKTISGVAVAEDDDAGSGPTGLDSLIETTLPVSGTYVVVAGRPDSAVEYALLLSEPGTDPVQFEQYAEEIWRAVQEGDELKSQIALLSALEMAPRVEAGAALSWIRLCWWGSLYGLADHVVLDACEKAVAVAEAEAGRPVATARDSRGLARALTGDVAGAIEDFSFYADAVQPEPRCYNERTEWIHRLEGGEVPALLFDDALLAELRQKTVEDDCYR